MTAPRDTAARVDWEARIGERTDAGTVLGLPHLAAPADLRAVEGRAQVTLHWEPVEGAVGYVVLKAPAGGEPTPIDTGGPDVMAVPGPPFADTTGALGTPVEYLVAAIPAAGKGPGDPGPMGELGDPVQAVRRSTGEGLVRVEVDASAVSTLLDRPWRPMIGSEHLSQILYTDTVGGLPIGEDFSEALRLAHDELGVQAVRAHAILHDALGVYREVGGRPVHDFSRIDAIYDRLLALGLRPIVELSFMPRDLARDPEATVFEYRGIISPPRDLDRWEALIADLAAHLVERYGLEEVRSWAFEVWNEANLSVFWSGTLDEYLRLYEVTARAIKSVDAALRVGGPASAAGGWIDELLAYCRRHDVPLDFVTTHTYGNVPLDLRSEYRRHGFSSDLPTWWTEWGVNAKHFNPLADAPYAAAFLVAGMAGVMGRLEALAYWVISDHFEELGRPPRLLHGGFGLLTVGNLRKPRYWGMWMLEQLGDARLPLALSGDGARSLVDGIATRRDDGSLALVVWNASIDHALARGEPLLDRRVELALRGLDGGRGARGWRLRHRRIDQGHSNIATHWEELRAGRDWPDDATWAELRRRNVLEDLEPPGDVSAADGALELSFDLPMPSVSLIELSPAG